MFWIADAGGNKDGIARSHGKCSKARSTPTASAQGALRPRSAGRRPLGNDRCHHPRRTRGASFRCGTRYPGPTQLLPSHRGGGIALRHDSGSGRIDVASGRATIRRLHSCHRTGARSRSRVGSSRRGTVCFLARDCHRGRRCAQCLDCNLMARASSERTADTNPPSRRMVAAIRCSRIRSPPTTATCFRDRTRNGKHRGSQRTPHRRHRRPSAA
jgi:hypothetical protein